MSSKVERFRLVIANQVIRLERIGGSRIHEALIVGQEANAAGVTTDIWCDRRIHDPQTAIEGWACNGAVVTHLTRI